MNRKHQRGVALVITLIMLAIITLITVIFLGIARRNRAGVSLRSAQTDAELATEAAFQRAKGDVVAQMMARNNLLGYEISVSRGYDLWSNGVVPLRDPRGDSNGPVIVNTSFGNRPGKLESRFFLDLNRDGDFQQSYYTNVAVSNVFGTYITTNFMCGDPEWIFGLERPDRPYGPNNRYNHRWTYIALPVGKSLDLNVVHNQSWPATPLPAGNSGFLRNEGVGAWELNFAALLHELDTNQWNYRYGPWPTPSSSGAAFSNAADFVYYRTNAPAALESLQSILGNAAATLSTNGIDDLGDDLPLGGGVVNNRQVFNDEIAAAGRDDVTNRYFPGSEALHHYFTHQDFFDQAKTSQSFTNNLRRAIINDPYKYYELLAQVGTDTGEETRNRINLNYVNLNGHSVNELLSWDDTNQQGGAPATNAMVFFTNVAQRILNTMLFDFNAAGTNAVPITNVNRIMIYPTNLYSGALHRVMQQAANVFDAMRPDPLPTVFRPLFGNIGTNLFIMAWTNDNNAATLDAWLATNTNGIPLVIGAKKGLLNFNEYTLQSDLLVTRKLNILRPDTNSLPNKTNQMYILGISNLFAAETWNSYKAPYPRAGQIDVSNYVTVTLTNNYGLLYTTNFAVAATTNWVAGSWPQLEFRLPLQSNAVVLTDGVYYFSSNRFVPVGTNQYEDATWLTPAYSLPLPYWILTVSNQLTYRHTEVDRGVRRVVDFVVLNDVDSIDVHRDLLGANPGGSQVASVWQTNLYAANGPSEGVRAQIDISLNGRAQADWNAWGQIVNDKQSAVDALRVLYKLTPLYNRAFPNTNLSAQTGFNPIARIVHAQTWQANDPLVHYHADNLKVYPTNKFSQIIRPPRTQLQTNLPPASLGQINDSYGPWGNADVRRTADANQYNYMLRDAGVYSPESWDFPTNRMPTVGWLGRVHRGTPWQTVYFKAEGATIGDWLRQNYDARNHPTNDWALLDIFTTALTDASTKGLYSVNQTRPGALSALFAGVVVVSNKIDDGALIREMQREYDPHLIEPIGGSTNTPLYTVYQAIEAQRARAGGIFTSLSQFLSVPELTTRSPFLNLSTAQRQYGIDDFAYERIPQQIAGLLRLGQPRFVVYAYGQALKPERINPSTGLVENYRVTAEFATRTVLRVEGSPQRPRTVVESFNILPPD
jgi:hypothetical protein